MTGKVTVNCDGIGCEAQVVLEIPDWHGDLAELSGEHCWIYCPDCIQQARWFEAQCPGCVASFSDCPLGRLFMYSRDRAITDAHFAAIASGYCPVRVNGTMMLTPTDAGYHMEHTDVSNRAPEGTGAVVAAAIRAYIDWRMTCK